MKTNTWKRALAFVMTIAAMMAVLAIPASAKTANGFRYYLQERYIEEEPSYYAVVTGYNAAVNGKLNIPKKLNGYEVYMISEGAFMDRNDITSVVIPETVKWVEAYSFSNCTNLKTLTVGNAYIETGAFSGCKSLRTVYITAYHRDYYGTEPCWDETENEPLMNADRDWVHYQKAYSQSETLQRCFTNQKVTLACDYDKIKNGYTYQWYYVDGYGLDPETPWSENTSKSVACKGYTSGEETVCCEVVNANGDVVYAQLFSVKIYPGVIYSVRNVVENTWLYGVTNYTVDHIRWQYIDPVLSKLNICDD